MLTTPDKADVSKARVYYYNPKERDHIILVRHFPEDRDAYSMWLSLPKGVLAAFRGAGDTRPVYSHDYVNTL